MYWMWFFYDNYKLACKWIRNEDLIKYSWDTVIICTTSLTEIFISAKLEGFWFQCSFFNGQFLNLNYFYLICLLNMKKIRSWDHVIYIMYTINTPEGNWPSIMKLIQMFRHILTFKTTKIPLLPLLPLHFSICYY